jgi:argininosuccinate synthase
MFESIIPYSIGLGALYEGKYRLGTALARPFIALEQVRYAKELGGATLIHGATGKGNDQIRFEYAYKSLAPECPVLAPWKEWSFGGRKDLIAYLRANNADEGYDEKKDYSLDENLWHLSIEGSELEQADAYVDVDTILAHFKGHFGQGGNGEAPNAVDIGFTNGVPSALDGEALPLDEIVRTLNQRYRHAPWGWDLIIENRFTGIKSRGLYINPAAKLLQTAVGNLAQCCLNKATYDLYGRLGAEYGGLVYRGEYFSDQRRVIEAAADAVFKHLNGTVTMQLSPALYTARILADKAIFRKETATFERSAYNHADAAGFINLTWLSQIGRPFTENDDAHLVETGYQSASGVCPVQQVA